MYYALIILSVVMFGGCFALNAGYQKLRGSSIKVSLQFSILSSVAGLIVLLIINGFKLEFTLFTFIMAMLSAFASLGFSFCSFKSLGVINLSLYSLFSMLGGMVLPFVQGIAIYKESINLAKIICLIFIVAALWLTVEKGEKSKGYIYYAGIFVLNGMVGVISKFFTEAKYPKTSEAGYSVLISLCTAITAAVILLLFFSKTRAPKENVKSLVLGSFNGITNRLANFLLLISLVHVDASVQYPMITGGVMIVSTIISCFGKNKPSKREIISVILAFIGMVALFAIPSDLLVIKGE